MAIQKNFTATENEMGFLHENAYYQIAACSYERTQDTDPKYNVKIMFRIYGINNPTFSDDGSGTEYMQLKFMDAPAADVEAKSGDNFLAKCYTWAMAQSDFSGATAV